MPAKVLRILLPVVLLVGGAGAAAVVVESKPQAERQAPRRAAQLVELRQLEPTSQPAQLQVTGVVTPRQEVRLLPQVGGKVTFTSESLVPGGRVKKGEVLVRIDARDYMLQVEQLKGQISSAELAVEQEQAQQALAEHEWKVLGEEGTAPPLFSRKSQKAAAESNLEANQSALRRARLNLARTTIRAPFDATVVSKGADVGQVVAPQSELAHLVGTEEMWVLASLAVEELDLIEIPELGGTEGSEAQVVQKLARGKRIEREGRVLRLVQQLDQRTRRAQVVIGVPQALDFERGLPLLPGAHVEVTLFGKAFEEVFRVPREAVYEGNVVWVAEPTPKEGLRKLARRKLEIGWGDAERVHATGGIDAGEDLVLTQLSGPIEGALVRPVEASSKPPEEPPKR